MKLLPWPNVLCPLLQPGNVAAVVGTPPKRCLYLLRALCFAYGRGFHCIPCNTPGLPTPALHCSTKPEGETWASPGFAFFPVTSTSRSSLPIIPSIQTALPILRPCHIWPCSALFPCKLSRARAFPSPGRCLRLTQAFLFLVF